MGAGTRKNTVKHAKIGAKTDFFTEKRHFPMDFFHNTFNHSIPPIHKQITIMKSGMYWIKSGPSNSIHPLLVENPHKSGN